MKTCTKCKIEKDKSYFYMTKKGLFSWCKECSSKSCKDRYKRNRKRYIGIARDWQKRNPDKVVATRKQRYKSPENQVLHQARVEKWKKDNPEKAREIGRKGNLTRRARVVSALVEKVSPSVVFDRDEGICGICSEPVDRNDWHMDHIIPIAKGGLHCYENVQVSHPHCNQSKGANLLATVAV